MPLKPPKLEFGAVRRNPSANIPDAEPDMRFFAVTVHLDGLQSAIDSLWGRMVRCLQSLDNPIGRPEETYGGTKRVYGATVMAIGALLQRYVVEHRPWNVEEAREMLAGLMRAPSPLPDEGFDLRSPEWSGVVQVFRLALLEGFQDVPRATPPHAAGLFYYEAAVSVAPWLSPDIEPAIKETIRGVWIAIPDAIAERTVMNFVARKAAEASARRTSFGEYDLMLPGSILRPDVRKELLVELNEDFDEYLGRKPSGGEIRTAVATLEGLAGSALPLANAMMVKSPETLIPNPFRT